jgi:hypothetical protein
VVAAAQRVRQPKVLRVRLARGRIASVGPVPVRRGTDSLVAVAESAQAAAIMVRFAALSAELAAAPAPLPIAA